MLMHARTPETSMTIQPQLLGGPPQALIHLQVRGYAKNPPQGFAAAIWVRRDGNGFWEV